MDPLPIILIGFKILVLVFAVKIARKKKRSGLLWFFICLFTSVIGFLILIVLPPKIFNCPTCGAEYKENQEICSECNAKLPDKYVSEKLGLSGQNILYDRKCNNCDMPYRLEDYDENAEKIYCSRCKSELRKDI